MIKVMVYIVLAVILFLAYVKYIESRSVFFPTKEIELTPEDINLDFQESYIQAGDGCIIQGWYIPARNAKYTILFFHGNAGNISNRLDKISLLNNIGLNLFIIDYRGYGRSHGKPSEKGLYLDAKSAYDYLVSTRKARPEQIIIYGESLGTAVAVNLASESKVGGIILEGAFSSARDIGKILYPFIPSFFFSNKFNQQNKIGQIKVAKLFLHAKNDEMIPPGLSKKLFDRAGGPKHFVELTAGGHDSAFIDSKEEYLSSIKSFIDGL